MGIIDFIMMKNLFGKSEGSGNGASPSMIGAFYDDGKQYEEFGIGCKISNLTPTIYDLENAFCIAKTEKEALFLIKIVFMDEGLWVYVSAVEEGTPIFIIVPEDLELEGMVFTKGIYVDSNYLQEKNISAAYLVWES